MTGQERTASWDAELSAGLAGSRKMPIGLVLGAHSMNAGG